MSATDVPAVCTTCGTAIPAGRTQCPGCKRVFGEYNRCPHCNAIAAVKRAGSGYTCVACNRPRELLPGTVVVDGDAPIAALRVPGAAPLRAQALGQRAGAMTWRFFGAAALGGGVLAAAFAAVVLHGVIGLFAAGVVGLSALAVALGSFRAARRRTERAEDQEHAASELAVLTLAEKSGGVLTATELARALQLGTTDADAILTRLAKDGERVGVEVDDQGVVRYVFRELRAALPVARVRVDDAAEPPAVEETVDRETEKAKGRNFV